MSTVNGLNKTIIITFGYRHGEPPPADMTVDVRDVAHHDYDACEQEAKAIAKEIEPGTVVAIGCDDGDDRSATIANMIQKYVDNTVVVDRDLSPAAKGKD
jgi:RNase adaptor protein for sRNA GlmZ degradation